MPFRHRHAWSAVVIALVGSICSTSARAADEMPEPPTPQINKVQREFLSRIVRRTVRDAILRRSVYEPDFVPQELSRQQAEVVVRLRRSGFLVGFGAAPLGPVVTSARDAARAASAMLPAETVADGLADLLIEIEVPGPPQDLPANLNWLDRVELKKHIEPGIHGLIFVTPSGDRRVCPSDMYTSEIALEDGLKALAQHFHQDPEQTSQTRLRRFRSVHWYEAAAGTDIVSLERGMLRSEEALSRSLLAQSISELAGYIEYRQRTSGLFAYEFLAGSDRYGDDDNLVRQVGAAASLAEFASISGRSVSAADSAIRYHLQGVTDLPGTSDAKSEPRAAFLATADGRHKLGATALLAWAIIEHPRSDDYSEARDKLVRGILWLQQPSGMFVSAFPPAQQLSGQDYFPGEALLALAAEYERRPGERVLKAFDSAMAFYGEYFRARRSPAFAAWQVQAFARMAATTNREDFARFAFEQADWLMTLQLGPSNCRWTDLFGAIDSEDGPTAASALYLEAFADALFLARKRGDETRTSGYESTVRGLTEFVLRLQIKPEEAYFARSRKDVIGGIRSAPASTRIRIDHCGHALVGLSKAQRLLFPQDR